MKIVVIGLGYVGLSNAVLLAQHNKVIGVDVSSKRVNLLGLRKSPVIDAELSEYLNEKELKLSASTNLAKSVVGSDYVIISTPTNYDEKTNFFDTSSVETVIKDVIRYEPNTCIVVKSTIPVGFVDKVRKRFSTDAIIFSPEFLREGRALYDNLYPSRIVVGEKSKRAKKFANLLAAGSLKSDVEILLTDTREAEAIKLFANTYLAMRVAFFNELDNFAMLKDMNSLDIIQGVSLDPRIGSFYNNPSFGFGGYCLPKDSKQLLATYKDTPQELFSAIVQSNEIRKDLIAKHILSQNPKTVGIYRLNMKSGSDNFRAAAVLGVIERLSAKNIQIVIYEPLLTADTFAKFKVINDIKEFKEISDLILANRQDDVIFNFEDKLFTRDLFHAH